METVKHCQSCYMPLAKPEDFGTEAGGSPSQDYCCHCYKGGGFTDTWSLEQAVEGNIEFWREEGDENDDAARGRIMAVFPTLKRWKTN